MTRMRRLRGEWLLELLETVGVCADCRQPPDFLHACVTHRITGQALKEADRDQAVLICRRCLRTRNNEARLAGLRAERARRPRRRRNTND